MYFAITVYGLIFCCGSSLLNVGAFKQTSAKCFSFLRTGENMWEKTKGGILFTHGCNLWEVPHRILRCLYDLFAVGDAFVTKSNQTLRLSLQPLG